MNKNDNTVWNTYGYVRLSHEDGDKEESNSVTGQKDLLRDYFLCHPELQECGMKVDDGFSGSTFERPAFMEMMDDMKAGKLNCIVVKDLSRFGRNYLDAGEYIEKIFPFFGVRFIAINDHYDSLHRNEGSDELIIPFKNIINEAYCRDTSIKIRSQLEIKRKRGDFIGSFAVYGYKKDPDNRHQLIVDDFAADVVRDIFRWKLEGVSAGDIADRLNTAGIASPMGYKKSQGIRFSTPFHSNEQPRWIAVTVLRILKNPVYMGVLEQGKNTTTSYKVNQRVRKPKADWAVIANAHEAIIDPFDYEIIQKVLSMDTRTSPGADAVELFSGMVSCGECGSAMIRKTVTAGNKKYVYYVCAAHKAEKSCSSHSLRDVALTSIVLEALQRHIQDVITLSDLLALTETAHLQKAIIRKLQLRLDKKQGEVERNQMLLRTLYKNLVEGVIDREGYENLKRAYTHRATAAEEQANAIREEMSYEADSSDTGRDWMGQFRKHQNIIVLDRSIVVSLIERVTIFKGQRVEIMYRWNNEFQWQMDLFLQTQNALPKKEAI